MIPSIVFTVFLFLVETGFDNNRLLNRIPFDEMDWLDWLLFRLASTVIAPRVANEGPAWVWLSTLVTCLLHTPVGATITYNQTLDHYTSLLDLYQEGARSLSSLVPVLDDKSPMVLRAAVTLYSLDDFDEVSGNIQLSTSVTLTWTDQIVQARTATASGVYFTGVSGTMVSLMVPYDKIWTPKVVLYNSVSASSVIGGAEYMCRYTLLTGEVTWSPKVTINSACSPDVTYYPFDRQKCTFTLVTWAFNSNEVQFHVEQQEWNLNSYEENGEWAVIETAAWTELRDSQSFLRLSILIERRPLYFAFNILLPVVALSLLTLAVFWLPSASGERVGFSVTCFLSFVVLLNTIMAILPRTASPMSYLCYYVVVMLVFSGLVTTITIVQVRIFHTVADRPAPLCMQRFVRAIKCQGRRARRTVGTVEGDKQFKKTKVAWDGGQPADTDKINREWNTPEPPEKQAEGEKGVGNVEVTWGEVSSFADLVFFLGFLGVQVFFSVTFLVPIAFGAQHV